MEIKLDLDKINNSFRLFMRSFGQGYEANMLHEASSNLLEP